MASFKDYVKGNMGQNGKSPEKKAPAKTGSFSHFIKAEEPTQAAFSKSPFNPNTPGHEEYVKQLDQKQGSTRVLKNFISSIPSALKTVGKTALELPKSLIEPFTHPSETTRELEQRIVPEATNPVQKVLTAIPRTLAKGFIRAGTPAVEGLGEEIGTFAADPRNPENLPQSNFRSFMSAANFGVAIGGSVKVLGEELGTKFINTSETLRITPTELRTKLSNGEIRSPQGQALARELITKNQTLEVSGTKTVEGVRGKIGKALGGSEQPANPQFKLIQNGEPIAGELKTPQTTTYTPVEQPQLVKPEIKTSRLSLGVEAKAVANKLTDSFQGLPEYAKVSVADQARAASNLLGVNRNQAISIALGHELPPEGILPESVFVAVENHALETKDVALLRDLATSSNLTTEATGMGQRLRMLAERDPNSAVSAMKKVMKIKEEAVSKKYGDISKAKVKIKTEIKNEVKKSAPKAKDWAGFLD